MALKRESDEKVFKDALQLVGGEIAGLVEGAESDFAGAEVDEDFVELVVVLDVFGALLAGDDIERRLGDVEVAFFTSSGMWRQKKVSNKVRMWEPSTSASVMMTIL